MVKIDWLELVLSLAFMLFAWFITQNFHGFMVIMLCGIYLELRGRNRKAI